MMAITPITRFAATANPLPVALCAEGRISLKSISAGVEWRLGVLNLRSVSVQCAVEDISSARQLRVGTF